MPNSTGLTRLIESTLTKKEYDSLRNTLGFKNNRWLHRKLNNPSLFTKAELGKLAQTLGVSMTTLLFEYGVGSNTLSYAEAMAIQNEDESLTAAELPTEAPIGAPVGGSQTDRS